jgi:hypothetical protein
MLWTQLGDHPFLLHVPLLALGGAEQIFNSWRVPPSRHAAMLVQQLGQRRRHLHLRHWEIGQHPSGDLVYKAIALSEHDV